MILVEYVSFPCNNEFSYCSRCAELSYALKSIKPSPPTSQNQPQEDFLSEFDQYTLAKSYFDLKEYDRAAYFVDKCQSQKAYFLHVYARYLGGEKKKYDEVADLTGPIQYKTMKNETLKALRIDLSKKYSEGSLDGFCLYLWVIYFNFVSNWSQLCE